MDPTTVVILFTAALGLYMAWNIGANDVANSMGCAVGSESISVKKAVVAAGLCEFAGAVLVGAHVTDTVRKGIVDPNYIANMDGMSQHEAAAIMILGMAAALLAAAVWLNISTWSGMPVSTSHAIVGAVAGFGIVAAGWASVHWGKMGQIVASWFISPVAGGILGFMIFRVITRMILGTDRPAYYAIRVIPFIVFFMSIVVTLSIVFKGLKHLVADGKVDWLTDQNSVLIAIAIALISSIVTWLLLKKVLTDKTRLPLAEQLAIVEHVFAPLVVVSSCAVAFSHGANDVANAVGPLAAIVDIASTGVVEAKVAVPPWVLMLGGTGIVIGLATYGYKVMTTIGTKITEITPSRGVAANIAATATVLACTRMKLPVSTTHTLVGAVLGIGLARGLASINRGVTKSIVKSWFITVPAAAILAIIFYIAGKALFYQRILSVLEG